MANTLILPISCLLLLVFKRSFLIQIRVSVSQDVFLGVLLLTFGFLEAGSGLSVACKECLFLVEFIFAIVCANTASVFNNLLCLLTVLPFLRDLLLKHSSIPCIPSLKGLVEEEALLVTLCFLHLFFHLLVVHGLVQVRVVVGLASAKGLILFIFLSFVDLLLVLD
jgi:hypothetical protein